MIDKPAIQGANGLRIAFVHHQRIKGGAEVSLELFVRMLHAEGFRDMQLICRPGWVTDALKDICRLRYISMPESVRPRSPVEWGVFGFRLMAIWYRMICLLKENKVDLVYCNSIPARLYAWFPCLLLNIRVVWHMRDVHFPAWLVRILLYDTKLLIVVSRFVQSKIPLRRKTQCELLYNAIDLDFWRPAFQVNFCHDRLGLPENSRLVVSVGHLVPWKEHDLFFDMAERLAPVFADVHFLLIGDPPVQDRSSCLARLQDRIAHSRWKNQLHIFPQMADLRPLFTEMSIFVHPSSEEPFGRVVMEAMAMGKAVVTMNSGGVTEIIEDGITGYLVEPRNVVQLAEKVSDILLDPALSLRLGEAGRKSVKDRFGLAQQKERLGEVIHRLLKK